MLIRFRKAMDDKDSGFTLIELLVVIIIIGILSAIAIPTFLRQREKGWDAASKAEVKSVATSQESYFTDAGAFVGVTGNTDAANIALLKGEGYNISEPFTGAGTMRVKLITANNYCIQVSHKSQPTVMWKFDSAVGSPQKVSTTAPIVAACPA